MDYRANEENVKTIENIKNMESIEKTKESFEESFRLSSFYNKQTTDDKHLSAIMDFVKVEDGMRILDVGTGLGYLAFPFAKLYKRSEIIGLDIVKKTLEQNSRKAQSEEINNLHFVSYEGIKFPFEDNSFDIVITRYALHHFPTIIDTFKEISRVLKKNGILFLSDPTPNEDDTECFVDEFMKMKEDGHIKFYTKNEWIEIGKEVEMEYVDDFETSIRFSRKKELSLEFDNIVKRHNKNVINGYDVELIDDEIWITERVNNILFKKNN